MAWFKKTRKPIAAPEKASRVPEGLWVKCPSCGARHLQQGTRCRACRCARSARTTSAMSAADRLKMLFDAGGWTEHDPGLRSTDPLEFTDTKPYRDRLAAAITSRRHERRRDRRRPARSTTIPVVVAAMEYSFIGGSMGVVVGEKITRAAERALADARAAHHRLAARAARA